MVHIYGVTCLAFVAEIKVIAHAESVVFAYPSRGIAEGRVLHAADGLSFVD